MRGSRVGTSFLWEMRSRPLAHRETAVQARQLDLFVYNLHLLCYGVL